MCHWLLWEGEKSSEGKTQWVNRDQALPLTGSREEETEILRGKTQFTAL